MDKQAQEDKLYTVSEALPLLGVTQSAISLAMSQGRLPFVYAQNKRMIRHSDLEAYRQRTQPNGQAQVGRPKGSLKASPTPDANEQLPRTAQPYDDYNIKARIIALVREMNEVEQIKVMDYIEGLKQPPKNLTPDKMPAVPAEAVERLAVGARSQHSREVEEKPSEERQEDPFSA